MWNEEKNSTRMDHRGTAIFYIREIRRNGRSFQRSFRRSEAERDAGLKQDFHIAPKTKKKKTSD